MYRGVTAALTCALLLLAPVAARAQTDTPGAVPATAPLSTYGALPGLELAQLSPSGQRIAFITVIGETRALAVIDLVNNRSLGGAGVGGSKVRDLKWIGEDRVLVTTSSTETLPTLGIFQRELYLGQIYEPGRRRITGLVRDDALFPALLSGIDVIATGGRPEVLVRLFARNTPEGIDLYRIDGETGRARRAEAMDRDVESYVLDSSGQSVARSDYDGRTRVWSLLLRQGGGFRETWRTIAPLDAPTLIGLGLTGESVILAADRPDLKRDDSEEADFYDVNLQTGVWRPVRFDFDPMGLLFHPVTGRLMGATRLDDEGRRYSFADEDAATMWASVEQTFADGAPSVVSWSDDLKTAVVFTNGAGDSGTYHLIDLDEGSTRVVGSAYAGVPADRVAPVRPVTYSAADGLEIHGYLTLPPGRTDGKGLPLVVLAHGGPASRDRPEFDWWAQAMASRGYAVLQANFRGSTGRGDDFMEAGYGEWGRKMQTDLSDGVRWLAGEGIVDPKRVCIVGASYGGYAALAGPTLDHGVYRCAVSVAGVSDLRRMVAWEAGRGERRDNETVRYWNRFMGGDGPGDRSLDARSPARLAETADAPILMLHGRDDTVVPIEQSRTMAAALRRAGKPVEFIELSGEDHWLSRGETRTRMLTETVRFLEAHNPPGDTPAN